MAGQVKFRSVLISELALHYYISSASGLSNVNNLRWESREWKELLESGFGAGGGQSRNQTSETSTWMGPNVFPNNKNNNNIIPYITAPIITNNKAHSSHNWSQRRRQRWPIEWRKSLKGIELNRSYYFPPRSLALRSFPPPATRPVALRVIWFRFGASLSRFNIRRRHSSPLS